MDYASAIDVVAVIVISFVTIVGIIGAKLALHLHNNGHPTGNEYWEDLIEQKKIQSFQTRCHLMLMTCVVVCIPIFGTDATSSDFLPARLLYITCAGVMLWLVVIRLMRIKNHKPNIGMFLYMWLTGRLIYGMIEGTI